MKIRDNFLPFAQHSFGAEEEAAVVRVIRSSWVTTGPETKAFEAEFADFVDAPYAIAMTSCTAALFVVYQSLGIGSGDEVVVPAMTWPATANAAALLGAKVVFADIDYATLNITPETLKPCLGPKVKAVAGVHFAGLPFDIQGITDLLKTENIPLIEDAAHAIGTYDRGRHIGGDYAYATCYSFHPIKNMTTCEGGMVTCHDSEAHQRLSLYKFHGIERDAWKGYVERAVPSYDMSFPSLKFNMPDILSAIGREQLRKVSAFNKKRRDLALCYLEILKGLDTIELPVHQEGHAWHLFIIKIKESCKLSRNEVMIALRERNIGTGLHFQAVHQLKYYASESQNTLLNAEKAGDSVISLPLYPEMTDEDIAYIAEGLCEVCL